MPRVEHDALRALAFVGKLSINDRIVRAVTAFLAAKESREKFETLMGTTLDRYRRFLAKHAPGEGPGLVPRRQQASDAGGEELTSLLQQVRSRAILDRREEFEGLLRTLVAGAQRLEHTTADQNGAGPAPGEPS